MLAVDEHRHQDRDVGGVGVAEVGVVVDERVALGQVVAVKLAHRRGLQPGAEDVHLKALGGGEQLIVGGDDRAREVAGHVEDGRAPGAKQRVGHLADDRLEPVGEHREQHRVDAAHPRGSARQLSSSTARSSRLQQVVAELGHGELDLGRHDHGRRRLGDQRRPREPAGRAASSRPRRRGRDAVPRPRKKAVRSASRCGSESSAGARPPAAASPGRRPGGPSSTWPRPAGPARRRRTRACGCGESSRPAASRSSAVAIRSRSSGISRSHTWCA